MTLDCIKIAQPFQKIINNWLKRGTAVRYSKKVMIQ